VSITIIPCGNQVAKEIGKRVVAANGRGGKQPFKLAVAGWENQKG